MPPGTVRDGDDSLRERTGMGTTVGGDGDEYQWGWKQIFRGQMGMGTNIHPHAAL